jgi:hypothetical protein
MRTRNVVLATVATALVAAPAALAANARLLIPQDKITKASTTAQVSFDLGPEWKQVPDAVGSYERRTELEPGAFCVLALDVAGAAEPSGGTYHRGHLHVRRPPSFELQDLRIAERGARGKLRWYRGAHEGDSIIGAAILPTPGGLAPKRLRTTIVRAALTFRVEAYSATQPITATKEQVAACRAAFPQQAAFAVAALLPTVKVERKPAG